MYREEKIFDQVAELGERVIAPAMEKIAKDHPSVGNVRGKGFFWAIEFVSDQDAKTPMGGEAMGAFGAELKKAGIWPMVSGHRLHFAPPLITTEEQLNWALEIVDRAASVVDQAL